MSDGDVELRVDSLREVLDVAVDVLRDYGDSPGETRIERMARWIVLNVGVQVTESHVGSVSQVQTADGAQAAVRVGELIGVEGTTFVRRHPSTGAGDTTLRPFANGAEGARQLATALLICAERSEQD